MDPPSDITPPESPTHAAIVTMVDNYTHFESLHKQHPDLAEHVFKEVNKLREVLDCFRITVALREAKQQQYTSIETNLPYEASVENTTLETEITPEHPLPDLEALVDTHPSHTETPDQHFDPEEE